MALMRFGKYTGIGTSTFALDLALLFLLTDIFHIQYLISAALAFVVAISINYGFSRRFVFKGTSRGMHMGYVIFLLIAGVGLGFVVALMYAFVDLLHMNYIVSRVVIAGVVGMWNYLMNLHVNFKVANLE